MKTVCLCLILAIYCLLFTNNYSYADYTITHAEYFIDTDPGEGKGIAMLAEDGTFDTAEESIDIAIDVSDLCAGTHYVYVRMKSSNGSWGPPQKRLFSVKGYIESAEYYFDQDPGEGNGFKLVPEDGQFDSIEEAFDTEISVSHLDTGMHTLYFRTKDNFGHWGTPESHLFYVRDAITAAEYFFDIDPGEGKGFPIGQSQDLTSTYFDEIDFEIQIPDNLTLGPHYVYLRMKTDTGAWGLPKKQLFTVNGPKIIVAAEYFVDTDPGFGNGTPLNAKDGIFDSDSEETEEVELYANVLSLGIHTIYIRMKDVTGNWGMVRAHSIEVTDAWIVDAEVYAYTDTAEGAGVSLFPSDGAFDETEEEFEGYIDTIDFPVGTNRVYVRAKSTFGVWSQLQNQIQFDVFVWDMGTTMPIRWDLPDITDNVMLLISRNNATIGSFEPLVLNTENDGSYEWTIKGAASEKCVISVVPVLHPYSAITLDPFTITGLSTSIQLTPIQYLHTYTFALKEKRDFDHEKNVVTSWHISDPSVAKLEGNQMAAISNGCVVLSTEHNGQLFEKVVFFNPYFETFEIENNDSDLAATRLSSCQFMQGEMLDDQVDYFEFVLENHAIVEIAYHTKSVIADIMVDILSQSQKILAHKASTNGETIRFSLGLQQGTYYVKLSASGDIDENATYELVYHAKGFSPETLQKQITINQDESAHLTHLQDEREFFFKLDSMQNVIFSFIPKNSIADYHITIKDSYGNVWVDRISENGKSFEVHSINGKGDYVIRVTPISIVDANNPFIISVNESASLREMEPNNTSIQACPADINDRISGNFSAPDDIDYFTFQVIAPQYFVLYFYSENQEKSYTINLYKDSDQNLINGIISVPGEELYFPFGLSIGKYYLKISSDGQSHPPYIFYIANNDDINLEIESNNTIKYANAISKKTGKKGRIFSEHDIDYYGFNLNEQMPFWIDFIPDSTVADYRVSLVNENYQNLYTKRSSDGTVMQLRNNRYPGNYYIKVENYGDIDPYKDYHLNISTETDIHPTYQIEGLSSLSSISISAPSLWIDINESLKLKATGHFSDASSKLLTSVIWTSIDPNVVSINDDGLVTGVSTGDTTIVAIYGGIVGRLKLSAGHPEMDLIQHHGNLILAAGGGLADVNLLRESTQYLSDLVYLRFRQRLFEDDDIYYINPMPWHDIDGDGYDNSIVDDDSPTLAEFKNSIMQWAANQKSDGPLYVYLIDHGGVDTYNLFPGEIIHARNLNEWLTVFQDATHRDVIIMIEACKSGTFIDNLDTNEQKRIIITSTNEQDAYLDTKGTLSFTQFFMDRMRTGDSIQKSYEYACKKLENIGQPYKSMNPQLVDDVLLKSDTIHLGGRFVIANLFSEIIQQSPDISLSSNSECKLFVEISDVEHITSAWAVVVPPYYKPPPISVDLQAPSTILPVIPLQNINSNAVFEGVFKGFKSTGPYRVTFYAQNMNNSVSISPPTIITITNDNLCDINGDGRFSLDDILILLWVSVSGDQSLIISNFIDINHSGTIGLEEVIYLMNIYTQGDCL
jgi:hypothetical protein